MENTQETPESPHVGALHTEEILDKLTDEAIHLKVNHDGVYYFGSKELASLIAKCYTQGKQDGIKESNSGKLMYERGRKDREEEIFSKVGFLRQWLNEKPESHIVTNEEIIGFLKL
jgi:hypothetical protein